MAVRTIEVRERVMARNDEIASEVRARLRAGGVTAFNLVSSPGSGKTLLLEKTLAHFAGHRRIAVIAGDVQTQNDADRLARHTDLLVHAILTGGACHLDARQVAAALEQIDLNDTDLVIIENVGNLVCPASWDLGEQAKIVLFSVTEGEDKPLKYPRMFEQAEHVVLTKIDLLPFVPFDKDAAIACARYANPALQVHEVSALSGEGLGSWCRFLASHMRTVVAT